MDAYPLYHTYVEMMTRIDFGYATLLFMGLALTVLLYRFGTQDKPYSRYLKAILFFGVTLYSVSFSTLATLLTALFYVRAQPSKTQWLHPKLPLPSLPIQLNDLHWLTILAIILRIPRLFDNFWYDEAFTAAVAQLPASNFVPAILGDIHPPLWLSLEWLIAHISTEEWFLRLPFLIFGVVNVRLIYRLTLTLGFNKKTARIAGLLIAVLPAQLFYSNEARGYTFFTTLVLIALLGILQNKPLWFIVGTALLGWTHNIGFVYVAASIGTALLYHRNQRWLIATIPASAINAIWLPFMLRQSSDISDGFWMHPITLPGAFFPVVDMTVGLRMPEHIVILAVVPVIVITLISLWRMRRWFKTPNGIAWLTLTLGVPAGLAIAAALWQPIYLTRALLPSATLLVIAWAWLIANRPRTSKLPTYALIASLSVSTLAFITAGGKQPVASYLDPCAAADSAYYTGIPARMIGQYYLSDKPQGIWLHANDLNQTLSPEAKAAFQFDPIDINDMPGDTICYFQIETPLTSQAEMDIRDKILNTYPHTSWSITPNNLATYHVYLLTKAN